MDKIKALVLRYEEGEITAWTLVGEILKLDANDRTPAMFQVCAEWEVRECDDAHLLFILNLELED